MTKIFLLKGKKYIYTLGLTNLDLEFRVNGYSFEYKVSNFLK